MKKPLLFALSAGALGYFVYATGILERILNRGERRLRRREASHRTAEGLLDLNSASLQELESLEGIGTELAERIVENRPYLTKIDLVGRMVVPDLVYEEIKQRITVRPHAA